jgi:6-phosphogluconolactonase
MKTNLAAFRMNRLLLAFTLLLFALGGFAQKEILYVGTYSVRGSQGIYVFEFDRNTGTFTPVQAVSNVKSPSFLAIHPYFGFLYAVNEGAEGGSVNAYAIDRRTGKLTFLNQQPSVGRGPCHVSLDRTGRVAFVSNYGEGTMTVLPVRRDGSLGAPSDSVRFSGSGPNAQRQEKPHAHSATVSPDNRFVYVCDLGTDRVYIYQIDAALGKVKPAATPFVSVAPGSGPRHFTFHPNGKFAYLVEELTSTTAVFARDAKTGRLTLLQDRVPTLPADYPGKNTSADIHTDASGQFLYQSNRGLNSLAMFAIAPDGRISMAGAANTEGKTPRNFLVDPKGDFVLVANQDSDTITFFKRDAKTGRLTYTGQSVSVPAPVCLKFMTVRQ